MRAARALRAHAAPFAVLTVTVAVLVGGVVTAVTVLAEDDGPLAAVLPLLVLGLVVVPPPVVELSRHRRDELALARLRGAHGATLVTAAAGLAALAAVLGGVLGTLSATLGPRQVGADGARVDGGGLTWAAAVTGGVVVLVIGCAWLALREPLAGSLRRVPWRPLRGVASGIAPPAGAILLAVAALVVLYQAVSAGDEPAGGLLLAGSGVVAVAVGQLAAVTLRLASPAAAAAGASRSVGVTLGMRRAVSQDRSPAVRGVVAAAVVAVASLSGASAAQAWAEDSTRLAHGAPLRADLPDADVLATYLLTRRLDPEGSWLMAGAVSTTGPTARDRVAWLDLGRYDAVAGDYLAGTGADLGPLVDRLRDAPVVRPVTGDVLTLGVRDAAAGATVSLDYVDDDGFVATATLQPAGGEAQVAVPGCTRACVALGLTASARVRIDALRLGDDDLLAFRWMRDGEQRPGGESGGTLLVPAGQRLVPADGAVAAPVVTAGSSDLADDAAVDGDGTDGTSATEAEPRVTGIGGDPRAVTPLARRTGLPLVEGAGVVGDLGVGLAAARGSTSDVTAVVLARADTPADVLSGLAGAGAEEPQPAGSTDEALGAPATAQERALRVVAVTSALLGLLALLCGAGRRTSDARRETAALRLLGVPRADRRRAGLVEAIVLGGAVLLATALAAWLCGAVVVDAVALVPVAPDRLPFGTALAPALLVTGALGAAVLLVAAVAVRGLTSRGRAAAARRLVTDGDPR